jgi:uncharacterized membrane protein YbhN (UPF0104 family)
MDALMRRKQLVASSRILVSAVALWLAFRGIDATEVIEALATAPKGGLALGFGLYVASQSVSALRWAWIVRRGGIHLSPRVALRYYFSGMFFSLLGPGFVGGDVARAVYLARYHDASPAAMATVLIDRYAGLVWLALIASASFVLLGRQGLPERIAIAVHVFAAIAFVTWLTLPRAAAAASRWFSRTLDGTGFDALAWWRDSASRLAVSGMSLAIHFLQIAATVTLARATVPNCPWQYCFIFYPLVALLSAMPVSVAGLGIRETSYVYFLTMRQDVARADAVIFALVWMSIVLGSALIGGIMFLRSKVSAPRRPT